MSEYVRLVQRGDLVQLRRVDTQLEQTPALGTASGRGGRGRGLAAIGAGGALARVTLRRARGRLEPAGGRVVFGVEGERGAFGVGVARRAALAG